MTTEADFSGMVDHFSLATTEGDYLLKLHSSTTDPHPRGIETAEDADGNIADQGDYIGGAGTPCTCVYRLVSGALILSGLKVGKGTNLVIESIAATTNNGEWPELTVSGIRYTSPPAAMKVHSLPAITINGVKQAQALGFTALGAGFYLTGTGITVSGTIDHVLSDKDTVGNVAFSGAELEITAEYTIKTGVPSVAWLDDTAEPLEHTGIVTQQAPAASGGIIEWATGNFSGRGYIKPDA